MATPRSVFSGTTENEMGYRKTVGPVGGKQKPKFALQDRSNVLKKSSSRSGTPLKAFGNNGNSLTVVRSKGKQENEYRDARPNKLFCKSKSFNELEMDIEMSKELTTKVEAAIYGVDENGKEYPPPEKMYLPKESDFDYYSSLPSPRSKFTAEVIHEDSFEEGYGGILAEKLNHPVDDNSDKPMRCMSPVQILPMTFGVYEDTASNCDQNF